MSDINISDLDLNINSLEVDSAGEGSEPLNDKFKVPLSSITSNYNPHKAMVKYEMNKDLIADHYIFEKAMGRRLKNGAMPLKNVTPRHLRIATRFLSGAGVNQIAIQFGCRASTISRILHDPLIRDMIEIAQSDFDAELKALLPLAVEAVRDALCHSDPRIRLQAVDRFARMTGKGSDDSGERDAKTVNIVNLRQTFIGNLRDIARNHNVIDVEAVDVGANAVPEPSS